MKNYLDNRKRGRSGLPVVNLDHDAARKVKGMLHRGDRQHDIAAFFGVNMVEVNDIAHGRTFQSAPVGRKRLPPQGPYIFENIMDDHHDQLKQIEASLAANQKSAALKLVRQFLKDMEEE